MCKFRVALARILTVISAHSDLPCMKSLAMDLATFLASIMCPPVVEQFDIRKKMIIGITEFFETTMRPLLIGCVEKQNGELGKFTRLLLQTYFLFDFSAHFLGKFLSGPISEAVRNELIVEYNTFSIRLQWSAITKLAYPPKNVFQLFNKEQVEKFERYRSQRVEVSSNTFEITPSDSTLMLVKLLGYWMNKKCIVYYSFYYSIFRAEAVFYLLERTADYMTENDAITINQILEHCTSLLSWHLTDDIYGASQFGKSLVNLFYSLSHLIRAGADADKQETICMEFALSFIDITGSTEEALRNLENYVESRTSRLDVMDRKPRQLRICALRCLGLSLSTNESDYVLNSLDSILILRLKILQTGANKFSIKEECIFELDVLSSLISTQEMYANTSVNESQLKEKNLPKKAAHVLWRLLLNLLRNFPSEILVEKICDVLSSGLVAI
uniref:HEAT repeat-containing protein 1 n=1 Tax=Wuchereria bancrofti TaxID=6293 RepID=A0A1I8EYL6_WUCBA